MPKHYCVVYTEDEQTVYLADLNGEPLKYESLEQARAFIDGVKYTKEGNTEYPELSPRPVY